MSDGWLCCLAATGVFVALMWLYRPKPGAAGSAPKPEPEPDPDVDAPSSSSDLATYYELSMELDGDGEAEVKPARARRLIQEALGNIQPGRTEARLRISNLLAELELNELGERLAALETKEDAESQLKLIAKVRDRIQSLTLRRSDMGDAMSMLDDSVSHVQWQVECRAEAARGKLSRDTQRVEARAMKGFAELKTSAAKRRRLESALKELAEDEHPDEQQAEHIARLKDALAKLDGEK